MQYNIIYYIPIVTTLFALYFAIILFKHFQIHKKNKKNNMHLLFWCFGIIAYGLGTLTEALTTLFGWQVWIFKSWYILGALLGGAPLAQGTIFLLTRKTFAYSSAIILGLSILILSVCVVLSPVNIPDNPGIHLSASVLSWQWIRNFSPFINLYAAFFLIGGAFWSSWQYFRGFSMQRAWGNIFIAIGAILPGIGGSYARYGKPEVLYVTELIGILIIFLGYVIIRSSVEKSVYSQQRGNIT